MAKIAVYSKEDTDKMSESSWYRKYLEAHCRIVVEDIDIYNDINYNAWIGAVLETYYQEHPEEKVNNDMGLGGLDKNKFDQWLNEYVKDIDRCYLVKENIEAFGLIMKYADEAKALLQEYKDSKKVKHE